MVDTIKGPPQETINRLGDLYNQGRLEEVLEQAQELARQYLDTFSVWNIVGAANKGLGRVEKASEAFRKVTKLNPYFADGFNNLGVALKDQGKLEEAIEAYERTLILRPDHAEAYNNMGNALKDQGRLEKAIETYNKAIFFRPNYAEAINNLGVVLKDQGKLEEAIEAYERALTLRPDHAESHNNMGNALKERGELDEAIGAYNKAIFFRPDYAEAYNNLGITLQELGKAVQAMEAYNRALSFRTNYSEVYNNMGNALKELDKLEEAIGAYNKALSLRPNYAEAYYNMGVAFQELNKLEEAIAAYNKALTFNHDYANAYYNMGNALKSLGRLEEAIEAYNKALSSKSDFVEAYYNKGVAFQKLGELKQAIEAYSKALILKSDYVEAHYNLGIAHQKLGELEEAISAYKKCLSLRPNYAEAYYHMGVVLQELEKFEEAIEAYNKALALKPDYEVALAQKLHQQAHICDWTEILDGRNLIANLGTSKQYIPPFSVLALEDSPERHKFRSELYASMKLPKQQCELMVRPIKKPNRLRIGYFSADFHNHATMYLMVQIFKVHDKKKFEVYAYSYGSDKNDVMRQNVRKAVDVFHDARELGNEDFVALIKRDKIDIAIDLKGYTEGQRLELFSYRPAPIQISFLGYPGTLGTGFIDYIIADPIIIPNDKQQFYSENVIKLPNTYQPTDNTREISKTATTRFDFSLPQDGFVFCCFNNNYKISPAEFDIWMRILNKVNDSILWLLKSNKLVEKNLKKEAIKRGVSADRLIFAKRLPQAEHLARHKHADLFLDTFNYNAHTTTSDALWAGLPVVTKLGQGFASRVAGSLLNAIGLPEFITKTEEEYEALILELATHPTRLLQVKRKLARNRLTQPLFDTINYTKHLESGYLQAYQRYFDGDKPDTIYVPK